MKETNTTVTASDIGACGYCAYKLYLQKNNGISSQTTQRFEQGSRAHDHYNKAFKSGRWVRAVLLLILVIALWWLWR